MSEYYEYPPFKVAAVQAGSVYRDAPVWVDVESTLEKAIGIIEEAGNKGARLIVFPECFLPCYPHWSMDLADRPTFNEIWAKLLWNSVEVPGREIDALCAAAKRVNAYVAMGLTERDKNFQGRMYNSVVYLSPQGETIGMHRKICNTVQERFFHAPGDGGDNLKAVYKTDIGNIGGSICGEHCQLLLTNNWIMQGIQIHCSLWPGQLGLETHQDIHTRALCYTAHCFGILSASYMPEADFPRDFCKNSRFSIPNGFTGGSGIVSPYGEYIAGPVYNEETIVYGDIDLADTDRSRSGINLLGLYSRWDLMNINVRQEGYNPLVPMKENTGPSAGSKRIEELEARIRQLEQQITAQSREAAKDSGNTE
ncbi:carbon-nitrogen hydrolase family protein [Chloroflexota bacterium]